MLTQMKRWGQIKGEVDYKGIAEQVFLATDTAKLMREMGLTPPASDLQVVRRDGQDVRSRQARRICEELLDQAFLTGPGFPRHSAAIRVITMVRRRSGNDPWSFVNFAMPCRWPRSAASRAPPRG